MPNKKANAQQFYFNRREIEDEFEKKNNFLRTM